MLTLPACHTDHELQLARAIARDLESEELHVFWSERLPEGGAVSATSQEPSGTALALAAVGALLDALASALSSRGRPAA